MLEIGSHLSPQILTFCPFQTLQNRPSLMRSIENLILRQISERLSPILASKILVEEKDLALSIWPTKEVGFYTNLQICFANKFLLKSFKSPKPKPHFDLASPNCFHVLQWITLSLVMTLPKLRYR